MLCVCAFFYIYLCTSHIQYILYPSIYLYFSFNIKLWMHSNEIFWHKYLFKLERIVFMMFSVFAAVSVEIQIDWFSWWDSIHVQTCTSEDCGFMSKETRRQQLQCLNQFENVWNKLFVYIWINNFFSPPNVSQKLQIEM